MALQNRRGTFENFDPEKLLPGEWAVVLGGDPDAEDGESVYLCFNAGNVKRMATYEDMKKNVAAAIAGQLRLTGSGNTIRLMLGMTEISRVTINGGT